MYASRIVAAMALAIALETSAVQLNAQLTPPPPPHFSAWRAYWENDSFTGGDGTDRHYTNGLRFTLTEHPDSRSAIALKMWERCWSPLCLAKHIYHPDTSSTVGTLVFGQNMFTPHLITRFDPDPEDRPFAGYLYGGYQTAFGETNTRTGPLLTGTAIFDNSMELALGVLGPMSLAGGAQAGIHVLRTSRIPKGWRGEIPNEPTVQLLEQFRIGLRGGFSNRAWLPQIELTPHVAGALGTVQIFGAAGATGRVGWNLSGLALDAISITRAPVAPPQNWEFAFVYAQEWRWFARNAFLDGGLLGNEPSVERRKTIEDVRKGIELRADPLTLSYRKINRTQEMSPLPGQDGFPDHEFGSVSLAYNLRDPSKVGGLLVKGLEHLLIEIGFGVGIAEEGGKADNGRATRVAAGLSFEKLGVSLDIGGVTREARYPDPDGTHTDHFFNTLGASAWWAPRRLGPGTPLLRVGAGFGLQKRQRLDGENILNFMATGTRPLAGVGYELPLAFSEEVALGFDLQWSSVPLLSDPDGENGNFLASVIGLKWRPSFD